jgi:hypothetical protein
MVDAGKPSLAILFIADDARYVGAAVVFQHKSPAMPQSGAGLSLELPAFTPSITL